MTSKLKPHETFSVISNAGLVPQKQQTYTPGFKNDKKVSMRLAIEARKQECKRKQ